MSGFSGDPAKRTTPRRQAENHDRTCRIGPSLQDITATQPTLQAKEAASFHLLANSHESVTDDLPTSVAILDSMDTPTIQLPVSRKGLRSSTRSSPLPPAPEMSTDIPSPEKNPEMSPFAPRYASCRTGRAGTHFSKLYPGSLGPPSHPRPPRLSLQTLSLSETPEVIEALTLNGTTKEDRAARNEKPSKDLRRSRMPSSDTRLKSGRFGLKETSSTILTSRTRGSASCAEETKMDGRSLEDLSAGTRNKSPATNYALAHSHPRSPFNIPSGSLYTPKLPFPKSQTQSPMCQSDRQSLEHRANYRQAQRSPPSSILPGPNRITTPSLTAHESSTPTPALPCKSTIRSTTTSTNLPLVVPHDQSDITTPGTTILQPDQQVPIDTLHVVTTMDRSDHQISVETCPKGQHLENHAAHIDSDQGLTLNKAMIPYLEPETCPKEQLENLPARRGIDQALTLNTAMTPYLKPRKMDDDGPSTRLAKALERQSVKDSPLTPAFGANIFDSDDDFCDTPMTSPENSPLKMKPRSNKVSSREGLLPQLDGGRGSCDDASIDPADGDHGAATARTQVESEIRSVLQLLSDDEDVSSDTGSSANRKAPLHRHFADLHLEQSSGDALDSPKDDSDPDEDTPLVTPSPAKGASGFPFPYQSPSRSQQRHPSLLLTHCERKATPRQRRLMTSGLRTPDRFISTRPSTPVKALMALGKRPAKSSHPSGRSWLPDMVSDPFGPSPRRSLRMSEQYATLRAPAPAIRPAVRAGTLAVEASFRSAARNTARNATRSGVVWSVGHHLVTEGVASTTTGRGGRITSGTNAPHYIADFLRKRSRTEEELQHGRRLALAMDVNQDSRALVHSSPSSPASPSSPSGRGDTFGRVWRDGKWDRSDPSSPIKALSKKPKDIPIIPFRVLDAPALRDDFYCSLLAYSPTMHCLAMGLGPHVYLWTETRGPGDTKPIPDSLTAPHSGHVASLSFSSAEGGKAILAIGRADGRITLWSPLNQKPRFDSEQPAAVSCVCWRPTTVRRPSIRDESVMVATDELLVGDEVGNVYYYAVEWPSADQRDLFGWHGSMTLLARIHCHTQQVCGIAWTADGSYFATGGNDNLLYLFETKKILVPSTKDLGDGNTPVIIRNGTAPDQRPVLSITPGQHKHIFTLNAAVKAVAFATWQPSLLAAGGGSNDRCIHFYHTLSGAKLATIDCHAQVTSLVWSERRKEIAATFGFAQPDHPYRVAVFSWPSCRMVVGIPWWGEERALCAVSYPSGPSAGLPDRGRGRTDVEGRPWYGRRSREEGCLVVATSDASIKFHEIWAEGTEGGKRRVTSGVLGGSQILEGECSPAIERGNIIR